MADAAPEGVDTALLGAAQQGLELGEDLLDRVQVGGVGRQEEQPGAPCLDRTADGRTLVGAKVVEDDDVAGLEGRGEDLLDIGPERPAVDRAVEDRGCGQAGAAERGDEGRGVSVPIVSSPEVPSENSPV